MPRPCIHAVIPMKPLDRCKMRLSRVMEQTQRELLTLWMLDRVAEAVAEVADHASGVILGGDARIQRVASQRGLCWRPDATGDLNEALNQYYLESRERHRDWVLYLGGDLPRLRSSDIRGMLDTSQSADLVLAPGARGGTNAILVHRDRGFRFALGEQSYRRHAEQGMSIGINWRRYDSTALHADVDTPSDLRLLPRQEPELWDTFAAFGG